jgi:hypothetical protein
MAGFTRKMKSLLGRDVQLVEMAPCLPETRSLEPALLAHKAGAALANRLTRNE